MLTRHRTLRQLGRCAFGSVLSTAALPARSAEADPVVQFAASPSEVSMSTGETSTEDAAIRMAEVLSTAMNLTALLANEPVLFAGDPVELRSTFLWVVDEMRWIASVREALAGISWPSDAEERMARLRAAASAWDPTVPVPPDVLDAARSVIGILQPQAEERQGIGSG